MPENRLSIRFTADGPLGPGNKKAGPLNRDYVRKIRDYVRGRINVVEIDLLRSSRDWLPIPTSDLPPDKQDDYYVVINRHTRPDLWLIYSMDLRSPLPVIPIPLRKTDKDAPLALQPVIDRVYRAGGHYHNNYAAELTPPLSPADAQWAAGLIEAWSSAVGGKKAE